ncbi:MAG TPA: hypothetical protein VFY25_03820 [Anaerolineales bacterium]|nr:hypothetical protein [Anaerolineales bacterium]
MNNNLYHWHDEHMVRHEMHEIDRAVQQARLLREAGPGARGGPGWLTRALRAVGNWLETARKGLRDRRSMEPGTFSEKSPRSA